MLLCTLGVWLYAADPAQSIPVTIHATAPGGAAGGKGWRLAMLCLLGATLAYQLFAAVAWGHSQNEGRFLTLSLLLQQPFY